MKVLLDATRLCKGGALQAACSVLNSAARCSEHEWHAVISEPIAKFCEADTLKAFCSVKVVPYSGSPLTQLMLANVTLPRIESQISPEVVYTIFGPSLWRARAPHLVGFAKAMLLYRKQRMLSLSRTPVHVRWLARIGDVWSRLRIRRAEYLIVESDAVARRVQEVLGYAASRVFVVRNSYSPSFAEALEKCVAASKEFPRVFVPAAYYPHKNLELVPRVAAILKDSMKTPPRFFLTVEPGAGWRRVQRSAEALGVAGFVVNLGPISMKDLAVQYKSADLVFLPTLLECATSVYPEALLAGIPIATSDLEFAKEQCGNAALYFNPWDATDAASVVTKGLIDSDVRLKLKSAGKDFLAKYYPSPNEKWLQQLKCLELLKHTGATSDGSI